MIPLPAAEQQPHGVILSAGHYGVDLCVEASCNLNDARAHIGLRALETC